MEKINIVCAERKEIGKEKVKKMRGEGFVPGIVYGKDINLSVKLPHTSMKTLRSIHFSESIVIEMSVEGADSGPLPVLIKDVQYHPLTEEAIHVDFLKISLEEKQRVKVAVELHGESKGVKEGGMLEHHLWEINIEALPLHIPEKIVLDISELDIGDSLHVKDIHVSDEVKVLDAANETIVTVVAKQEEEEEAEVALAGETPVQEPQVIKEKKEEPGEETKKEEK